MKKSEELSVLFFIKKTKLLKNGEAPIFVRIYNNFKRVEFGMKYSVPPKHWDNEKQEVKNKYSQYTLINSKIEDVRKQISSIVYFYKMEECEISPQIVKDKLLGKTKSRKTILGIFKEHNEKVHKLKGIDFAPDTVQRYDTSLMHTKDFIKWKYNREDLYLDEINQQFISNYELYFKTVRNCAHNTTIKYIKNFKKIIRIALDNKWIQNDPFSNIKYKLKQVDATYLTEEELNLIRKKEIGFSRIAQVRDVFLFCAFTGLAFADVKGLRLEHVSTDKDGITWLHKRRQKTEQMSSIFLIDSAKEILAKYANDPVLQIEGKLLPVLSNQKMNAYLKEIADICGINKNITTHCARHTFATTVALGNNVPIEVVSKTLGHSTIKMTQRYAQTTENLIKKNMSKIANY